MDLQYYKIFTEHISNQGVVGLLRPLNQRSSQEHDDRKVFRLDGPTLPVSATDYFFVIDEPAHPIYVFKIPLDVNTLADHEYKIAKDMEELSTFLPHFNRFFEVKRNIKCYIPEKITKKILKEGYNPFSSYNCVRDISIIEYIPSKLTLLKYIKTTNFADSTKALLHQLILALFIAQQEKKFTHYDLHLENVLLRRCSKRTFFMYTFVYESVLINRLVFTNGYFPVLFDYGFAYSQGLECTSYNNSLFFTKKGYTPFMFDEINDFRTLLVRLTNIKTCPDTLKALADKYFLDSKDLKFDICEKTGWFKTNIQSAARIISCRLEKIIIKLDPRYKDNFIYKELDNLVDLFGTLIKLPIGPNNFKVSTLESVVKTFLAEWNKIDIWFNSTSSDDKLNIMKRILETVNELLTVENSDETIDSLVHSFKLKLFCVFDAFGDFVNIQDLDYGKFLISLIEISNFIERIAHAEMRRYNKLFNHPDFMDNWSLFTSIENIVSPEVPYTFEQHDSIVVFNCVERSTSSFNLEDNDVIETLNLSTSIQGQIDLLNNLPVVDSE